LTNPESETGSNLLDDIKNEPITLSSATNDNMDVHVYGPNLATVSGTTTEKGKDKHGKEFTCSYVWVDTWAQWRMAVHGRRSRGVAQKEVNGRRGSALQILLGMPEGLPKFR